MPGTPLRHAGLAGLIITAAPSLFMLFRSLRLSGKDMSLTVLVLDDDVCC